MLLMLGGKCQGWGSLLRWLEGGRASYSRSGSMAFNGGLGVWGNPLVLGWISAPVGLGGGGAWVGWGFGGE
jgi:hypothetical protein